MKQKLFLLIAIILIGCSNNNHIEKIAEANALISSGSYEKGIKILEDLNSTSGGEKNIISALANAHLQYGNFLMYNEEIDRKIRYMSALKEYRSALKLDNNLSEARSNAELIESIYTSMGREIPK